VGGLIRHGEKWKPRAPRPLMRQRRTKQQTQRQTHILLRTRRYTSKTPTRLCAKTLRQTKTPAHPPPQRRPSNEPKPPPHISPLLKQAPLGPCCTSFGQVRLTLCTNTTCCTCHCVPPIYNKACPTSLVCGKITPNDP